MAIPSSLHLLPVIGSLQIAFKTTMVIISGLLTIGAAALAVALPADCTQKVRSSRRSDLQICDDTQRAAAVQEAFQHAWDGYYKYAFPQDELLPVTNGASNSRNGWGASAVDAFSTALVMQNQDVVNIILDYVPTIDWGVSYQNEQVSLFETTIRYLAGILSAYDLLNGPLASLAKNKQNVPALLEQAKHLADNLSYAFDTPTGIPHNNLYIQNRTTDGAQTNGLATIGSLVLEWTHLSDLTGDMRYGQLAQQGEQYLLEPMPQAFAEPFPGLLGTDIRISDGQFVSDSGGWNGGDDSYYEYLIKMFVYDNSRFMIYRDRWIAAADSSITHLASHPASRPDLTFLAHFEGQTIQEESGHLACFDGGNFILGGLVLKQQKYIDFGLQLVEACEDLYNQTVTGIGPEGFGWDAASVPAGQEAFYKKSGYYIENGGYYLRPEVIESFYYAYRATGDKKYQDYAWSAFLAINSTTRVGSGFSEISDVNTANGGEKLNFQDSFFFAEVLKYSYLIHAPDAEWQVNHEGKNAWVYNTEAHPIKVAGTPI